ncbi:MAG: sialidase family protein [Verrucomicrobiales bacterium]
MHLPTTISLLLSGALLAGAAEIPFIDLAHEAERQVVVDREAGQYLGHPTTCVLDDGKTVLCVYPKGHGKGAIVYKRSGDGGKTWSDRLPTPPSWATSKEVPTLFRTIDADGKKRIILFSGLYPIRMAVSEDEGETWGELEPIGEFGGIVAMSSVVRLDSGAGHYLALFHDDGRFIAQDSKKQNPTTMTLFGSRSTDGGLTWDAPQTIYASSEIHLCEPGALRSPDGGQIAVLLRENARRKNSFVIFSNDEGETWSEPRELPVTLTGDRHTAKYLPDGRLFISFRGRFPSRKDGAEKAATMPTDGDWAAWVGTYEDIVKGQPGQYVVRIADNKKGWDTTYPGVELLPDGTVLTTTYGHWEQGAAPYILSVRLRAEELDARAASAPKLELAPDGRHALRLVPELGAERIWDAADHNAFTDLVRWRERFYCAFRESDAHVYGRDGTIRILVSEDGGSWQSFALIGRGGTDLRDPKLSVTPDDRLMLLAGGSKYEGKTLVGREMLAAFADDGGFGAFEQIEIDAEIATGSDWLWRVTWHGGTAYGVVYQAGKAKNLAHLVAADDGVRYRLVRSFELGGKPSEATVRFDADGRMMVVVRNDGGDYRGWLGVAAPPFTDWDWRSIDQRLGGPELCRTPDGSWLVGTRRYSNPPRTVVGKLDPDSAHFEPLALLPSSGDTSYPGMVVHDGKLWISYYASHSGKAAIYFAKIDLPLD